MVHSQGLTIRLPSAFPWLGFVLSILVLPVSAQVEIKGTVVDAKTGAPIPFVSILQENTGKGTISNDDGAFRCTVDTVRTKFLRFSFIGYESFRVPVSAGSPVMVRMESVPINLPEVVILAGKRSWAADLVAAALKQMRRNKASCDARAFLSVVTTIGGSDPLEVLEGFYRCTSVPRVGVTDAGLKQGRFGLFPLEGFFFINNQPTSIMSHLRLFEPTSYKLPEVPFALGSGEMKRHYRIRTDTLIPQATGAIAVIRLIPRTDPGSRFEGMLWIDTLTSQIRKVVLTCRDARMYPFVPLDSSHRISGVSLRFEVTFREIGQGWQVHDLVRFDYTLGYTTPLRSYPVSSRSLLLLYDYETPFVLPRFFSPPGTSDYSKILSMPYNHAFWEQNYIIPASQAALDYTGYFSRNGIMVNYQEESLDGTLFPRPVVYWKPGNPLSWDRIPAVNPGWIRFADPKRKRMYQEDILSRTYFLDFQLFLDLNPEQGKCSWQSASMLFLGNSFYEPERDSLALRAIELEFDITELYRRRLERRLDSAAAFGCDSRRLLMVYDKLLKEYEGMRWLYRKEVKRGQNPLAWETWRKRIALRLEREGD